MPLIPVARIRFSSQTQEGPGFSSSSVTSCLDPTNGKNSRHRIWLDTDTNPNQYRIEFYDRHAGEKNAEMLAKGSVVASGGDNITYVPPKGKEPSKSK